MKKILLIVQLTFIMLTGYSQVSYNGNIPYTTPESAWDGISADCGITIIGSATQNGINFDHNLHNLQIKSLRIRQKNISPPQIPSYVINEIKNDARIEVSFDLYVNNVFIERYGQPSVSWARLQGLPDKDGYKPATKENGYKLYNNGALSIRNVRIKQLRYRVNQEYYDQIGKEIAGNKSTSTQNSTKSGTSTNLSIATQNSQNNNPATNAASINTTENTSGNDPLTNYNYSNNNTTNLDKAAQIINSATPFVNQLGAQMEANRLKKEANQAYENANKEKRQKTAKNIIYEYLAAANNGDEAAISKVFAAYQMMEYGGSSYSIRDKEGTKFLESIDKKFHNSAFTTQQLSSIYKNQIKYYDKERKKKITRTLTHSLLGSGLIVGALSATGEDPIILTGATLLGGYMSLSGIVNLMQIGSYGKSSSEYKNATKRLGELNQQRVSVIFSPGYNPGSKNAMFALSATF